MKLYLLALWTILGQFIILRFKVINYAHQIHFQLYPLKLKLIKLKESIQHLEKIITKKIQEIDNNQFDLILQRYQRQKEMDKLEADDTLINQMQGYVGVFKNQLQLFTPKEFQKIENKYCDLANKCIKEINLQKLKLSTLKLHPRDVENVKDYAFSYKYKHKDIKIENKKIAEKTGQSCFSLIYSDESFDPQYESTEFDIEILQKVHNIWVGVGQAQNTRNIDYTISRYGEMGHGQYMLVHSKLAFHSTDAKINNKGTQYSFVTGDTIRIQYSVDTNVLKFSNLKQKWEYSMKITQLEQKLHPVVLLYQAGDKVRISNGQTV